MGFMGGFAVHFMGFMGTFHGIHGVFQCDLPGVHSGPLLRFEIKKTKQLINQHLPGVLVGNVPKHDGGIIRLHMRETLWKFRMMGLGLVQHSGVSRNRGKTPKMGGLYWKTL